MTSDSETQTAPPARAAEQPEQLSERTRLAFARASADLIGLYRALRLLDLAARDFRAEPHSPFCQRQLTRALQASAALQQELASRPRQAPA